MRRLLILCAAMVLGATGAFAQPRIAPIAESAWSQEQRDAVATYWKGPIGNDVRTFATNPALVKGISPFANYIVNDSTLNPRQRELLILRAAALAKSDYLWGKHAKLALDVGLSKTEIERVAKGPDAKGWTPLEATLLRAADEIHDNSFISTPTWDAMSKDLNKLQLIDATMTVAEFTMMATTLNSIQVEPDKGFAKLPKVAKQRKASRQAYTLLATPRIHPLQPDEWTEEQAKLVDPKGLKKPVFVVIAAIVQHPAMYVKRQTISDHIRSGTTLPPRVREMAISRILARTHGHAEYSGHLGAAKAAGLSDADAARIAVPGTAGFSTADADVVRAVDEIFDNDRISESTWKALSTQFTPAQIVDLSVAAGGYRMVGMFINSFGTPVEPGRVPVPTTMP